MSKDSAGERVRVGVADGVEVGDAVLVAVAVFVEVGVKVAVRVRVDVAVAVWVGVGVGVNVFAKRRVAEKYRVDVGLS